MSLESLCSRHTVPFYRSTESTGAEAGGNVRTESATPSNIKGFMQPATPDEVAKYGRFEFTLKYVFYTTADPLLDVEDRAVWKGESLSVRGVVNMDEADRVWKVLLSQGD